jgi:hypothetical protein
MSFLGEESAPPRFRDAFELRMAVELQPDRPDVVSHGRVRDAEASRDPLRRNAFREQRQHLESARSELELRRAGSSSSRHGSKVPPASSVPPSSCQHGRPTASPLAMPVSSSAAGFQDRTRMPSSKVMSASPDRNSGSMASSMARRKARCFGGDPDRGAGKPQPAQPSAKCAQCSHGSAKWSVAAARARPTPSEPAIRPRRRPAAGRRVALRQSATTSPGSFRR